MLTVRSRRVVLPDGERPAAVHIADGVITGVSAFDAVQGELIDAGDSVVAPGIVDTHVHVNEPGRTDWEGFDTATRAAAAGGVTTIVDMPLNSIPATIDVASLAAKREAARGHVHVDVAFWGGIVPGNAAQLPGLIEAGVRGFKCFLTPSGVDEFASVGEADLRVAFERLRRLARHGPVLAHAENPARLLEPHGDPRQYATFARTRPATAEADAIDLIGRLAAEYDVRSHIVHVSSADGVAAVARARAAGSPVTAETCPHYLTFTEEDVPAGATAFKCAPPLRGRADRHALWAALDAGVCDLVASDHSPSPPELKSVDSGNFLTAWGGIASLELALAAVWTGAVDRGRRPADIARWMSAAPSALCGLSDRKGALRAGHDADLVIWDPDDAFIVDPDRLQQRHKLTPYAGRRLRGVVRATFVRGECVWDGQRMTAVNRGRLL